MNIDVSCVIGVITDDDDDDDDEEEDDSSTNILYCWTASVRPI